MWLESIRWPESIQAFAAVVALLLAIYIPLRIRSSDRAAAEAERQQKADALALFISADVFEISVEAGRASAFLKVYSASTETHSKRKIVDQLIIKAAERLQPTTDRLWLLERNCAKAANLAIADSL